MAETTADNQATKPTPSTPLPPAPDLGDGPWDMSTGINNPNNQRDYTREPKGTINTNGGLLGVLGNVFDKLMELLARLFGSLFGKDTESIADKKADIEFNLENFAAAKKEYERGIEKTNDHYAVNKSLNIPEYANKDIASEYLMFTHFGNGKIMLSNKDGKIDSVLEASIKENFMRCFSISIDQIKGHKGDKDLEKSVPFSVWMASPVYKRVFDASIDKDALLVGLSSEEKELMKKAKYMTKAQRDEAFKDHPELEDKFTFVRNTALAVSNADIMANTITVESSIKNTAVADFRFVEKDQMGAFQLTAQTALEFAGKTFKEKERISLGQKVLAELNISGKPQLSEAEVKNMVKHVLGSDLYGGDRTRFISSLTTYLNGCKNQKEFEAMVGSVYKIFGDENTYLQIQQNIMSEKMAWALNKVGGAENFNQIMQEGSPKQKGQLIVDMSNYYAKDGGPKFTAKELYGYFAKGKEAKTEDDALFELGKLAEQDSKVIFGASHVTYHGSPNKQTLAETFQGVDLFTGKAAMDAEKVAVEIAANSLTPVPKEGLNPDAAEKDWLIAHAAKLVNDKNGTMLTLHQDETFKNYDMVKGTSAKEMLEMLEKAKISKEDRENPVFQSLLQKLKDHPEAHIDGTPYEYILEISKRIEEKGEKDALSADISQIKKDVESRRADNEYEVMGILALNNLKEKTFGGLLNEIDTEIDTNGQRRMIVEQYLAKNPDAKGFVDFWKSHKDASLIHYEKFSELVDFYAKNHKEITENGKSVEDIVLIAASQKIDDFKRQTLTYLDRRIGVEGDEKMRGYHIQSGPTIANTYASLDDLVKDAKDVMSLYQSDKSLNHKDFIQSHDDLAKLFNVVTYGPVICNKMGLPYEKLQEILVNELVKEGMFNTSSIKDQQKDAEKFIKAMTDQKRDAFNEFSSLTMSKRYEEGMESIFVGHEITPALASFLIKKGILKDEAFSKFSMFDDMDNIKVKLDDGTTISLNDFGLKNFTEEYYAANFNRQNEKWGSLAKEKGIEDKTDNSNKGLDAEALAKVKEQADNKKEDVKVASIGI